MTKPIENKKILFCVTNLGLGHATRSLPIIKHYVDKNKIFVLSTGNSLSLLKKELEGKNVTFCEYQDYPPIERGSGLMFYFYLIHDIMAIRKMIKKEHKFVGEIVEKNSIDFIFSDCRYGCYSTKVPSFAIAHQVSFSVKALPVAQAFADNFNVSAFKKFTKLLIPDYEDPEKNLASRLSHPKILEKINHEHIGILSSIPRLNRPKDIDYLFIISGFLKEHVDSFVSRLLEEAKSLPGKKVFILGDMSKNEHKQLENDIETYSYAPVQLRNEIMNRAKVVVSRSGYTTVMDLVEIGVKGVLIPTSNQSEQEFLADYLGEKKYFLTFKSQDSFSLKNLPSEINKIKMMENAKKTMSSLEKIDKILSEHI